MKTFLCVIAAALAALLAASLMSRNSRGTVYVLPSAPTASFVDAGEGRFTF